MKDYLKTFELLEAQEAAAHTAAKEKLNLLLDKMTAGEINMLYAEIQHILCEH